MIIMKIFIEKTNESIEKTFSGKGKDLLKQLKINSETILLVRNKELITEEDILEDSNNIKILSVISGG